MADRPHPRPSRPPTRGAVRTVAAVALLFASAGAVHAAGDPEDACRRGRYNAAAKYAACQLKMLGKARTLDSEKVQPALSKCRLKYTATWAKLQAQASGTGSTCDNPRFGDNADGTVTDRLTALQWEKKTDDASVHDRVNFYSWTLDPFGTEADGTAFTGFLATVNGACFAGHCDWRLPTVTELQTILLEPYPCTSSPCINQAIFGPTVPIASWAATTDATEPMAAWWIGFVNGAVDTFIKGSTLLPVRAVRGGL